MAKGKGQPASKKTETLSKFSGLGLKFKSQLSSLQKNAGNEAALYQLRVCLKKTLSLTEFLVLAPIEGIDPERHYKKFKILQKKISKARDLQVQAKLLQKYRKPSGKAETIFFSMVESEQSPEDEATSSDFEEGEGG
jgi:CHAD domain-containing protein